MSTTGGCYVIRVSPEGRADPECGPSGPYSLEEARSRAHTAPDQFSGWRDLIVAAECRWSFTRDQLIDVISRLEAYPATLKSGRVVISAESMADAIIEGLEADR